MATHYLGRVSIVPKGTYSAGTEYSKLDMVTSAGSSYIYINATPGAGHSLADTDYWMQTASKGDTGATGATGPQGEPFEYGDFTPEQLAGLVGPGGSPAGAYATTGALASADPDHGGVYLVTADGHWYYWNGSAWADGGLYQATSLLAGDHITLAGKPLMLYPDMATMAADLDHAEGTSAYVTGEPVAQGYRAIQCHPELSPAARGQRRITMVTNPAPGDTITIEGITFTAVSGAAGTREFVIGTDQGKTGDSLYLAVIEEPSITDIYTVTKYASVKYWDSITLQEIVFGGGNSPGEATATGTLQLSHSKYALSKLADTVTFDGVTFTCVEPKFYPMDGDHFSGPGRDANAWGLANAINVHPTLSQKYYAVWPKSGILFYIYEKVPGSGFSPPMPTWTAYLPTSGVLGGLSNSGTPVTSKGPGLYSKVGASGTGSWAKAQPVVNETPAASVDGGVIEPYTLDPSRISGLITSDTNVFDYADTSTHLPGMFMGFSGPGANGSYSVSQKFDLAPCTYYTTNASYGMNAWGLSNVYSLWFLGESDTDVKGAMAPYSTAHDSITFYTPPGTKYGRFNITGGTYNATLYSKIMVVPGLSLPASIPAYGASIKWLKSNDAMHATMATAMAHSFKPNPFSGKTALWIGDSIFRGYSPGAGTDPYVPGGQQITPTFSDIIAERYDMTCVNYGWDGSTVRGTTALYKCAEGGVSGSAAPSHYTGTAADGTVTWQIAEPPQYWGAGLAYEVGDVIYANSKWYECTAAGTSGSVAPLHTSGEDTDGTVTWLYVTRYASWTGSTSYATGCYLGGGTGMQWVKGWRSQLLTGARTHLTADYIGIMLGANDGTARLGTVGGTNNWYYIEAMKNLLTELIVQYPNALVFPITTTYPFPTLRDAILALADEMMLPRLDLYTESGLRTPIAERTLVFGGGGHATQLGHVRFADCIGGFIETH